jgi:UDP-GlcNAc:undecaprenyl-phosphate GlcNAc-1-phosphate transferase
MFHHQNDFIELPEGLVAFIACALSAAIVLLARRIPWLAGGLGNLTAKQATHTRVTPRIGGLAIFIALAATLPLAPETISSRYATFVMCASFLFLIGLAEDIGFNVSPRMRLAAAAISSILVIVSLDVWLPRADVPLLDNWMGHWAVGVPLTLLVTAGVANGFNLIDGVNGLASLAGITAAVALALIADAGDYSVMVRLAMMLAAAIFGFAILNYPLGLVFLGDGGAYTLGFVLSWFAISVLINVPTASAWAMLLVVFWPVFDTLLAIWRRRRKRASSMAPDRLHVHQLVMRALEIHMLGRRRRHIANPLTTLILAPAIIAPPMVGVMFWDRPAMAFLSVLAFAALYSAAYVAAYPILRALPRVGALAGSADATVMQDNRGGSAGS